MEPKEDKAMWVAPLFLDLVVSAPKNNNTENWVASNKKNNSHTHLFVDYAHRLKLCKWSYSLGTVKPREVPGVSMTLKYAVVHGFMTPQFWKNDHIV